MSSYRTHKNFLKLGRSPLIYRWRKSYWSQSDCDATSETGLTLIECLAAIVVVGLIGAAIAPVLALSVATRVQSQKAEQAVNLAQSEVDFVRTLLERGDDAEVNLVSTIPIDTGMEGAVGVSETIGPDDVALTDARYPDSITTARPVDIDRDGDFDFAVQVYRDDGSAIGDAAVFRLGVRVYTYETAEDATTNLSTEPASIGLTSGVGDRSRQPLAAIYSSIAISEDTQSLCNLVEYLRTEDDPEAPLGCNAIE